MSNDNTEVFARLFKLWAMICKMIMDGKRDAKAVADMLQGIVDGPSIKKVLTFLGNTTVSFASKSELEQFTFEDRDGLWISEAFTTLFGTKVSSEGVHINLGKYQLTERAFDSTIIPELEHGHIFKGETGKDCLKRVIASCVLAQWGGTQGTLLNNGNANIFYLEHEDGGCIAVSVRMNWHNQRWGVNIWEFDGGSKWTEKDIVFSLGAPS